jgi:uncharacterized protein
LGLVDRLRVYFEQGHTPDRQELDGALWHACRGGQLETVQLLIEKGADRSWLGWDHLTPLDGAHQSGNAQLIEWLRQNGAKRASELR